jgi:hypothetical protein
MMANSAKNRQRIPHPIEETTRAMIVGSRLLDNASKKLVLEILQSSKCQAFRISQAAKVVPVYESGHLCQVAACYLHDCFDSGFLSFHINLPIRCRDAAR